jgi:hypothetical protein
MGRASTAVLKALDVMSTLLSGMTSVIEKHRSRTARKHLQKMKALSKKSKSATQKRCASGYNLFVSTNIQKTQALPVFDFWLYHCLSL